MSPIEAHESSRRAEEAATDGSVGGVVTDDSGASDDWDCALHQSTKETTNGGIVLLVITVSFRDLQSMTTWRRITVYSIMHVFTIRHPRYL